MKKVLFIRFDDEMCYGVRLLSAAVKGCDLRESLKFTYHQHLFSSGHSQGGVELLEE